MAGECTRELSQSEYAGTQFPSLSSGGEEGGATCPLRLPTCSSESALATGDSQAPGAI